MIDVDITEQGKFYTIHLNSELAINWSIKNLDIPLTMTVDESNFFMDDEDEVMNYIKNLLKLNMKVILNNKILDLNSEDVVIYA